MLIRDKGTFAKGALLLVTFLVILVLTFMPLFNGHNALEAADNLFNSIAKGSTYYIKDLVKKNEAFKGNVIDVSIKLKDQNIATQADKILSAAGAKVTVSGTDLKVNADLGTTIAASLADSDAMFHNKTAELQQKYGFSGKEALYAWWNAYKEMDKDLKRQKKFKEAAFVGDVIKKGVEVGYNFVGIQPESAASKMGILSFSLVFYVIYTLWWGIAILLLFEGIGLEMKAGAKKEV